MQSKYVFKLVKLIEKRLDLSCFSHYYLLFSKLVLESILNSIQGWNFVEEKLFAPISFTGDLV